MSERAERCETCRFFDLPKYDGDLGSCHIRSCQGGSFPPRNVKDWCGEWKPVDNDYWSPLLTGSGGFKAAHDAIVQDAFDRTREAQKQKDVSVEMSMVEFHNMNRDERADFLREKGFKDSIPIHVNEIDFDGNIRITQHVPRDPDAGFSAMLPHPDAIPQWRKRPTMPGLYVCFPGMNGSTEMMECIFLGDEEIKAGAPYRTEWCYGPIEKPKDE